MDTTRRKYNFLTIFFYTWIANSYASVNLARGKATKQSSILDGHGPDLAVDGIEINFGQFGSNYCTQTLGSYRQVWWQVDLGQISQIKTIEVIYRENFESNLQYASIYASTDANWWKGKLCHKNDRSTFWLPAKFTVTCVTEAKFVTIYNDRNISADAYLDLCEVKVIGCPKGKHGHSNCLSDCQPHNCKTCDPESGLCTGCNDGTFGLNCNLDCQIPNCKSCERFNGTTCSVCQEGFAGNRCQQCAAGRYGKNCSLKCPAYCLNSKCNSYGLCTQGCVSGFSGLTCEECMDGRYGLYCQANCQLTNCKSCERYTGTCTKCKDNYTGPKCENCIVGKYGYYCNVDCPSKCRDTCDKRTGNCDSGCMEGWSGLKCEECSVGHFGNNCDERCHCRTGRCHSITGNCYQPGCVSGYQGISCNKRCSDGYFGDGCKKQCFCKSGPCDSFSGKCILGECKDGYTGDTCSNLCENGRYGAACNLSCKNCKEEKCNHINGTCFNGCKDGWSGNRCNIKSTAMQSAVNQASKLLPIYLGCFVGVFLVISAIVILIFLFRRKHNARKSALGSETTERNRSTENLTDQREINGHAHENEAYSEENEAGHSLNTTYENTNTYYNVVRKDTRISELRNLILKKNENDTFQDEYNKLPNGLVHPHEASVKPENIAKNRFKTVFSYDHSRVKLDKIQNDEHSDYINANYIDGVDKEKAYIATQGPRKNTLFDFWRMVLKLKCNKIVMLTGLIENGKVKCERYWPNEDTLLTLSYLHIEMKNCQIARFYTKRLFCITDKNTKDTHFVHQYHFTTWPDHGTPDPLELVLFHRFFSKDTESTGPVLVHCSAGIGRTGTFIALDALYQYGMKTETVDIYEFVKNMRKDRMNMIQTLAQYIFLYEVLLEAFEYEDTAIKTENFLQMWKCTQDGSTIHDKIKREFQALEKNRPVYQNTCYEFLLDDANSNKNSGHIYSHDKFRPFLISFTPDRNNYINAVLLPSHKKQNAYIATHSPLPSTLSAFWCLLYDHSDDVIIFDYSQEEMAWFPCSETPIEVDEFTITRKTVNMTSDVLTEIDILLKFKNSNEKSIKVLLVQETNRSSFETKTYLKLFEMIGYGSASRTITVVSPDGVVKCGIFCTTHSTIQRIQIDKEIDLYHTVRKIQERGPEFIKTFEQYRLCYDIIKDYLDTDRLYCNT